MDERNYEEEAWQRQDMRETARAEGAAEKSHKVTVHWVLPWLRTPDKFRERLTRLSADELQDLIGVLEDAQGDIAIELRRRLLGVALDDWAAHPADDMPL